MSYNDGPRRWAKPKATTPAVPNANQGTAPPKQVTPVGVTAEEMTTEQFKAGARQRREERKRKAAEEAAAMAVAVAVPKLHPWAAKIIASIELAAEDREVEVRLRDLIGDLAVFEGEPTANERYEVVRAIVTDGPGLREIQDYPTVWSMPQTLPQVAHGVVQRKAKYDKPLPGRILEHDYDLPEEM